MPTLRDILLAPAAGGALGGIVARTDTALRFICAVILWISFAAIFIPTFANAVLRYTTNSSLAWSVEIAQLVFPWLIAAGASLAAQHGRHISVAALFDILSEKMRRRLSAVVHSLVLVACCAILYVYTGQGRFEGGMEFAAGDASFTSLGVSQSWSYLALPAGYFMLGLTAITSAYRLFFPATRV